MTNLAFFRAPAVLQRQIRPTPSRTGVFSVGAFSSGVRSAARSGDRPASHGPPTGSTAPPSTTCANRASRSGEGRRRRQRGADAVPAAPAVRAASSAVPDGATRTGGQPQPAARRRERPPGGEPATSSSTPGRAAQGQNANRSGAARSTAPRASRSDRGRPRRRRRQVPRFPLPPNASPPSPGSRRPASPSSACRPPLLPVLTKLGAVTPFPIQEATLPAHAGRPGRVGPRQDRLRQDHRLRHPAGHPAHRRPPGRRPARAA